MKEQPSHARYLRWLYELLLSIYFVLMFVGTDSFGNFVGRVSRLLNHGVNTSDYSFGAQYLSWFLLAAFIFVVLRILGQIRALKAALCQLVGSAVFVVPIVGRM